MALATGLTTQHKLAGLTVLSGWFAIREKIKGVCISNLIPVAERFDAVYGSFSLHLQPVFPSSGDTARMTHWSSCPSQCCPRKSSERLE
jgi:hypothetical protein